MPTEPRSKASSESLAVMLVALALIVLSFWNAPQNGFVYDDNLQVERNPLIQTPALYGKALTSDVWAFKSGGEAQVSNYYRPVFTAWCIANHIVFGLDPAGWHFANILLHALATWLAWRLLRRLGTPPVVAAIVAWIFAAHPVHVESVTWVAGSPDPLLTIFGFWALDKWLQLREKPSAVGQGLVVGATILAMGSKEAAIALVPIAFCAEFALSRQAGMAGLWLRALKATAPFAVGAVAFIALRSVIVGPGGPMEQQAIGWGGMLATTPQLFAFYVRQLVFPMELSTAYPLRAVTSADFTAANFWIPLAVSLAVVALFGSLARKRALCLIGAAIFVFFLIPSFYIKAFHPEHIVRDRYLYIPVLGFFLVLIEPIAARLKAEADLRHPLAIGGGLLAAALGYLSMSYNPVWFSNRTMWEAGVKTDPKGYFAHMNLAESLRQEKLPNQAIPIAKKATELNPNVARPWTILGMALRDVGNLGEATVALEKATSFQADTIIAAENLGQVYQLQGRIDDAVAVFRKVSTEQPGLKVRSELNIAVLYFNAGRTDEALQTLEELRPHLEKDRVADNQRGWFFLGELYLQRGQSAQAAEAYRTFLARTPLLRTTESMRNQATTRLRELGQSP